MEMEMELMASQQRESRLKELINKSSAVLKENVFDYYQNLITNSLITIIQNIYFYWIIIIIINR